MVSGCSVTVTIVVVSKSFSIKPCEFHRQRIRTIAYCALPRSFNIHCKMFVEPIQISGAKSGKNTPMFCVQLPEDVICISCDLLHFWDESIRPDTDNVDIHSFHISESAGRHIRIIYRQAIRKEHNNFGSISSE